MEEKELEQEALDFFAREWDYDSFDSIEDHSTFTKAEIKRKTTEALMFHKHMLSKLKEQLPDANGSMIRQVYKNKVKELLTIKPTNHE